VLDAPASAALAGADVEVSEDEPGSVDEPRLDDPSGSVDEPRLDDPPGSVDEPGLDDPPASLDEPVSVDAVASVVSFDVLEGLARRSFFAQPEPL
jgi:hypothetical protein